MFLIGLTGGIAAGKSVVAGRMAELGAVHIDADALAREVVEPGTEALRRIEEEFGPGVIAPDGSLDRGSLGAVVFAYPEKLALLNSITHPAVRERSRELIEQAREANPRAIVVYDVPLLVEAAVDHPFDIVVVVSATEENRLRRLTELRGMSRLEALRRMASQAPESERLAIADVVIDANGSLEDTRGQVDAFWSTIPRAG